MKKYIVWSILLVVGVIFNACSKPEDPDSSTDGWHFQGRDCLACHNVDLNEDKHLLVAGTLYKSDIVSNQDDMNSVCGGDFVVNFLDANMNTVYSSRDYEDFNSKGNDAKGNLFILRRKLSQLSAETFRVQIKSKNGVNLALSNFTHSFTTEDYDINKSADFANRVSCNSCHINGGTTAPLYVQTNASLCK